MTGDWARLKARIEGETGDGPPFPPEKATKCRANSFIIECVFRWKSGANGGAKVSGIYGMANITNNLQSDKTKVDFET